MLPDFLIIGLSQLAEPVIPSLCVKLDRYGISWRECLEEALLISMREDSKMDEKYFTRCLDYDYGESLMDRFEEKEDQGEGEFWPMYDDALQAFCDLCWIYYTHFFQAMNNTFGNVKCALDSLRVETYLELSNDIILALDWDQSRL